MDTQILEDHLLRKIYRVMDYVIAKKKRGIQYCEVATRWGKANGYKEWRYLFIPSKQVMPNSSFMQLAQQFRAL